MKENNNSELFPMQNPENWWYQIQLYIISHNQLQIKVHNDSLNQTRYIGFNGVKFYDGPLGWAGRGFSIADSEERLQVLKKIEDYRDYSETHLAEFTLYVVNFDDWYRIRILSTVPPFLTEENLFSNYVP